MNRPKGFSLIELLVVIAIIGLLSTMAVVSLNNARQKARDSRRMGDIKALQTAMEMFKTTNDNDAVPKSTTWAELQTSLATQLPNLPIDPQNTATSHYVYCHYNSDVVTTRSKYVFAALLEGTTATPNDIDTSATMTCVNSDASSSTTGINCSDTVGNITASTANAATVNVLCLGQM